MSIRMHEYEDGKQGLAAFCDVCGDQIREHGFIVWNGDDPSDWLLIHQSRCDPGRAGGAPHRHYDSSMGLDVELVYLANSAGIDLSAARKSAGVLSIIG